ncbi:response regulator [Zobellia uliginosa]|uniref:response regulator n=1 Tax=Zobellia uliginosa TaxID=143224 RepID=UPI001C06D26F|nr:response regulator transcription factor [Zobellia uliginosa]MBU2948591.1 response regulator transcription factor [Zobellia uliginosa]
MITIAITDDHQMVVQGIETMLRYEPDMVISYKYNSVATTIEGLSKQQPDILLLDINLPDGNGIDLCKKLMGSFPKLKIIALSSFSEIAFVKRILSNGASGYLLKNTSKEELITAFKTVLDGGQYLQKDIQKKLLQSSLGQKKASSFIPKLTRREKEVLTAISEELTTNEIADKLCISSKTVETHRMNLISKLGARNSVGLIKIAMEKGLLKN